MFNPNYLKAILIYVRDKYTGYIHIVGTDKHDRLYLDDSGNIQYLNLQNGGNVYDLYLALSRDHLVNEKNDGNVTYYYAMDGAYDYENYYDLIELDFADLEVNEDE